MRECVCMCVYVCVCVCACAHPWLHACACACVQACMRGCAPAERHIANEGAMHALMLLMSIPACRGWFG